MASVADPTDPTGEASDNLPEPSKNILKQQKCDYLSINNYCFLTVYVKKEFKKQIVIIRVEIAISFFSIL